MTAAVAVTTAIAAPVETTFGRDGALFEALLGFVAQMSLVLWALVIFTVLIRFVGIRVYRRAARRGAARQAAVVAPVDSPADLLPPAVTAVIDAAVDAAQPAVSAVIDAAVDLIQPPEARPATVAASVAPVAAALPAEDPRGVGMPPAVPAAFPAVPALAAHGAGPAITLPYRRPRDRHADRHATARTDEHLPAMSVRAAKP
ncbi:hypothetical protein QWJ39_02090 [Arthrobacter sp. YD4]|uniref:hypothetical protein n=1 Tax=Arthrobacter sp. YD4 TaxID=3058043 RepID=UPI0025B5B176|nr:hypothetical protein [Arthrobacter sp. YD4]MDN3935102.1 hypothetical protein [Arthrobacter sp. YD4]